MSKKGIIAAVIVVALLGAGAGFYFLYPVELEIKDTFEVGDKHTVKQEYEFSLEITEINGEGGELTFLMSYSVNEYTYAELVDQIEDEVYFYGDVSEAETTEELVNTNFGKRNCFVYTFTDTDDHEVDDSAEFVEKLYVGKNNNILYKSSSTSAYYTENYELKKSSIMTESLNGIEIKPAESLKVGDNLVADVSYQRTDEIAEILPAEGNTPETYRLMGSYGFMTSDEVIYALSLEVPDEAYEESEYLGTETVSTPLGRVVCDVYLVSVLGMEGKLYVHNDILVNVQGERIGTQWTHSDFIVKKSMF